jgi:hypothetical protein
LTQCRPSRVEAPVPFLGQQLQPRSEPNEHIPPATPTIPVSGPEYDVAMSIMLRNVVAPMSDQPNDPHAAVLDRRVTDLNTVDPEALISGPADRDVESFLGALHGASSQYFRMLAEAPRYLTPER